MSEHSDGFDKILNGCSKLFVHSVGQVELLYCLGIIALVTGFFILVIQAVVKLRATPAAVPRTVATKTSVPTELVKAITEFTKAISEAPAPIVLFAMGLLLMWSPAPFPSEACIASKKAQAEIEARKQLNLLNDVGLPIAKPATVTTVETSDSRKITAIWTVPASD